MQLLYTYSILNEIYLLNKFLIITCEKSVNTNLKFIKKTEILFSAEK